MSILVPLGGQILDGTFVISGVASIPVPGPNLGSSLRGAGESDRGMALHRYVAGNENRLAVVALGALLEGSGRGYNPLVLHGPHGLGKSHLARGLVDLWNADDRRGEALVTTAADFAREFATAIASDSVDAFRKRHRTASLWVLEDLGDLTTKQAAQQELLLTLDTLSDAGAVVVVTSRSAIGEMPRLHRSLVSRLSAGLVVALSEPGKSARLEIFRDLAAARDIPLAPAVAQLLAEEITGTVFDLAAALLELYMAGKPTGGTTNIEWARRYLADRAARSVPTLREIVAFVAKYFSVKQTVLRSGSRTQSVVLARGVAMYLARRLTTQSLKQIGRSFSNRDHTTVLHHCRKIDGLLGSDPMIRRAVVDLERLLTNYTARR